jgi:hypothetical protein
MEFVFASYGISGELAVTVSVSCMPWSSLDCCSCPGHEARGHVAKRSDLTVYDHMKILVMGGAGFIDSYPCARLLARGPQMWCVDNMHLARQRSIARLESRPDFHSDRMTIAKA